VTLRVRRETDCMLDMKGNLIYKSLQLNMGIYVVDDALRHELVQILPTLKILVYPLSQIAPINIAL
jgi:hypothetical protein